VTQTLQEKIVTDSDLLEADLCWALGLISEPTPSVAIYVATPGQLAKLCLEETMTVFL
jgi:hypothetical protein